MNSRFITYPSTVDKEINRTILLIDATVDDIENIGLFCKSSNKDYDIYLYRDGLQEIEWLTTVAKLADEILIANDSTISIDFPATVYDTSPLKYFQEFDLN